MRPKNRYQRPDDLISANEIACWAYCPEQFRLQYGLGLEPENRAALDAGTRHHARKAAAHGYIRGEGSSRYLLLLKGHDHPDPIHLALGGEDNVHRDFRLLEPWEALINAHIARYRVPVPAGYRDILNDPKLRSAIRVHWKRYYYDRPQMKFGDRPDLADADDQIEVPAVIEPPSREPIVVPYR